MKTKRIVKSACRMCHGICQVLVHMEGERVVKITGDPQSPISRGYLCPKGAAAPELLYHPDRIRQPLKRAGKRGENRWVPISWDEALEEIAGKFRAIKEESGAEYVGMTQGTGRPYENIYNRFANAFGTPNFTAPAHICYLPRIMVSLFSTGFPLMPVCDVRPHEGSAAPACIVIWGCNLTGSMGHDSGDCMCGGLLSLSIRKARKVIVIDPRRINPAEKADHWLQLRPGTDGALALAMIHVVISENLVDREFINNYTTGFNRLSQHVEKFTPEWAEPITRVPADDIRAAARTYATTKPACIQWGNGLDQSACNFQTARSVMILRALTGNLDVPGGDFFPTWPREMHHKTPFVDINFSGLQYCPPENMERKVDHGLYPLMTTVQQPAFWRSIVTGHPYRMRAVWIMSSNPLLTATHSLEIEEALKKLEFVVVSEFFLTPTAQYADIILPSSTWLEYDEAHTSGGNTYAIVAERKVAKVGDTRNDQDVIIDLAHRLGLHEAFPWKDLRELNEWALEGSGLGFDEFLDKGIYIPEHRYYKYKTDPEFFNTPSKKFEIYSETLSFMGVSPLPVYREPPLTPVSKPDLAKEFPLTLMAGVKMKAFFHSEGRQLESLRKMNPDPLVEIHPDTAATLDIGENDWVWIETPVGRVKMRAKFFDGIAQDVVSAQHAWWFPEEDPPEYGWKKSSVNLLFGDTEYDPDTGSESLRNGLCRVYPVSDNR
ncbi:MAG: molybdopterin-dependent oxidoreductase [Proteobacteria bacterium]|nr:molybdopterin-dependent oxidoreductase [Pseudomonadota bacterium]